MTVEALHDRHEQFHWIVAKDVGKSFAQTPQGWLKRPVTPEFDDMPIFASEA
jgi:hypothetical protein